MVTFVEDFIAAKTNLFESFDEYLPQLEQIEKANKVCNTLLNKIDNAVDNFDMDAFNKIDEKQIAKDLSIPLDVDIKTEHLVDIYKEIENSFELGGRVSLTEYISQGNLIYASLQNDLMGEIDYTLAYSEEELKKREKLGFERFALINAMNNIVLQKDDFDLSPQGEAMVNKCEQFLNKIVKTPKVESIEEKIADLNYTLLSLEELSLLKCKSSDSIVLNNEISRKFSNILGEVSEYLRDENVFNMYIELNATVSRLCEKDSNFNDIYQESQRKLNILNEALFEHDNSNGLEK